MNNRNRIAAALAALTLATLPGFVEAAPERPGYVWVQGSWAWDGLQYAWTEGRYVPERTGALAFAPGVATVEPRYTTVLVEPRYAADVRYYYDAPDPLAFVPRFRDYRNDPNLAYSLESLQPPMRLPVPPDRERRFF
jgi:hypothetical protein